MPSPRKLRQEAADAALYAYCDYLNVEYDESGYLALTGLLAGLRDNAGPGWDLALAGIGTIDVGDRDDFDPGGLAEG